MYKWINHMVLESAMLNLAREKDEELKNAVVLKPKCFAQFY